MFHIVYQKFKIKGNYFTFLETLSIHYHIINSKVNYLTNVQQISVSNNAAYKKVIEYMVESLRGHEADGVVDARYLFEYFNY